jgi:hypothetical protein
VTERHPCFSLTLSGAAKGLWLSGPQGAIVNSEDGDHWTASRNSATTKQLNGVAWNGSRFVAVGLDGTIVHRDDADHWTAASHIPTTTFIWNVVALGSRFVALGTDATILHSEDGDRWTVAGDAEHIVSVVWDGTQFVAVAADGMRFSIVHSLDGDTWSEAGDVRGGVPARVGGLAAQAMIAEWIDYYNKVRPHCPHSGLAGRTHLLPLSAASARFLLNRLAASKTDRLLAHCST